MTTVSSADLEAESIKARAQRLYAELQLHRYAAPDAQVARIAGCIRDAHPELLEAIDGYRKANGLYREAAEEFKAERDRLRVVVDRVAEMAADEDDEMRELARAAQSRQETKDSGPRKRDLGNQGTDTGLAEQSGETSHTPSSSLLGKGQTGESPVCVASAKRTKDHALREGEAAPEITQQESTDE